MGSNPASPTDSPDNRRAFSINLEHHIRFGNMKEIRPSRLFSLIAIVIAIFSSIVSPATAATTTFTGADSSGPTVLVFSLDPFTDSDEEDTDIRKALVSISSTVKVFDGGDGSTADWQAALSGVDVLVFPEVHGGNYFWQTTDTAVLTAGAKSYIKSWVEAGKLIVGTGSYTHLQMITDLTGVDFTGLTNDYLDNFGDPWARLSSNTSLPASVPSANYTGGIENYSSLSTAQKTVMERVYYDATKDNVAVANFTVGSGFYVYNAYDWYPSDDDVSSGRRAEWDATLQFAASGAVTGQSFGDVVAESSQPPLSLPKIDSIFPTRVVAGETISIIGKRWTCTTTATYASSTSPVAHGWLTPQLEQIDFKVPVDQPTGPLQFTLNSCAGQFEINGLVTVVPAPMSITYLLDDSSDLYAAMTDVKAVSALHRGDFTKAHCIVNSQVSEAEKIQVGYEICSTAMAQMPQGSRMEVTLRSNYLGGNTWTRVWFGN